MATMSAVMKARVSRRTGGVDRLLDQYKSEVANMTSQYQSDFSRYQAKVAEQMAPFQAAMSDYQNSAEPKYLAELAAYNTKLEDYQKVLAEIDADPVTERTERVVTGRTWYGKKKYGTATFYDPKPIPTFDAVAPEAPGVPEAPKIDAFDSSQFDERRKEIGSNLQRELGERKAARLGAVQRRGRTLLNGASN